MLPLATTSSVVFAAEKLPGDFSKKKDDES
jgi:hypothetical protein